MNLFKLISRNQWVRFHVNNNFVHCNSASTQKEVHFSVSLITYSDHYDPPLISDRYKESAGQSFQKRPLKEEGHLTVLFLLLLHSCLNFFQFRTLLVQQWLELLQPFCQHESEGCPLERRLRRSSRGHCEITTPTANRPPKEFLAYDLKSLFSGFPLLSDIQNY